MPIMCARPCVCQKNCNDMAESGVDPVSGVRVMGCVRGRGRGVTENGYRDMVSVWEK